MNTLLRDFKSKAQRLAESQNPPRLENGRKKGYMRTMKELWDKSGFRRLDLTSPNLRDQAARLETSMGDARIVIAESVGLRVEEEHVEESERREVKVCNLI